MSSKNRPYRRKLMLDDDDYDDVNFEDIEVAEYKNLVEYRSCFTQISDCFKVCLGLKMNKFEYEELELELRSDTDSFRHEIDLPIPNRRSSSQAEDDHDSEDMGPAIDSTREQSEEDTDEEPKKPIIEEKSPVPIQLSDEKSSESEELEESSSGEISSEGEQDFSNMFCLKDISPRLIAQFMLDLNRQILLLKQIRNQYSISLKRAKSATKSTISIYDTENKIMIIDRLYMWYKKVITELDKFMSQAKKYSDWSAVYLTHSPDIYINFIKEFILEKRDTTFLAQKEPHELPILPDLPQFLQ
jgi:hypothetical protein